MCSSYRIVGRRSVGIGYVIDTRRFPSGISGRPRLRVSYRRISVVYASGAACAPGTRRMRVGTPGTRRTASITRYLGIGNASVTRRVRVGYASGTRRVRVGYASGTRRLCTGYALHKRRLQSGRCRLQVGYTPSARRVRAGHMSGTHRVHVGYASSTRRVGYASDTHRVRTKNRAMTANPSPHPIARRRVVTHRRADPPFRRRRMKAHRDFPLETAAPALAAACSRGNPVPATWQPASVVSNTGWLGSCMDRGLPVANTGGRCRG